MLQHSTLRRRAEFRTVYSQGIKVVGRFLVVFALPGERREVRLGITATRKTGSAVVRNRARRRVRALFARHGVVSQEWAGDAVVNVRRSTASAPWCELEEDYLRCLLKATASRPGAVSPLPS